MKLNDAIQHLKESLADSTNKWGCEECKAEHVQMLLWLEEYEKLKSDYNELLEDYEDLNKQLRKAKSMASARWIPCEEKPPERIAYLVTDGYCVYFGYYDVFENHWTTEEDTDGNSLLYWMPLPKPPKEE